MKKVCYGFVTVGFHLPPNFVHFNSTMVAFLLQLTSVQRPHFENPWKTLLPVRTLKSVFCIWCVLHCMAVENINDGTLF